MSNSNTVKIIIAVTLIMVVVFGLANVQNNDSSAASQAQTGLSIGDKASDFEVTTFDSVSLTLENLQGKILVITSGAGWCPTCVIESKNFNPVYQEVKDKNVEFITVHIDPIDDEVAIAEFQKHYAPWHNIAHKNAEKMIKDYGFWRFEITYIIDRKGTVRFIDSDITSTETLRSELDKLI